MGQSDLIPIIRGERPADILFTNALLLHVYTGEWEKTAFSVTGGVITGIGERPAARRVDLGGAAVVPGFIDAHVHIESSLLPPETYGSVVLAHGTTTVFADPHEIANTCAVPGLEYMFAGADRTELDIFYLLPSCVPATPLDESVAVLDADALRPFSHHPRIAGLGEMMNVPGVLSRDPEVLKKLGLYPIRDGHAPLLSGPDLQAYIAAGIQSDHETIFPDEAREKLRLGMFLYIREGSAERNLRDLIPVVTRETACRCSFCTDDRHVDMLFSEGHIDDCIRNAIQAGCEPELAYRMASLSPAERFGILDRGALVPGKIADFCVLDDIAGCRVRQTYKRGNPVLLVQAQSPEPITYPFRSRVPGEDEIRIPGEGLARVLGITEGQIATRSLIMPVVGEELGDTERDLLKVVVASRYHDDHVGIGIVHGLHIETGAIAGSIAHDSHHVIATGADDDSIRAVMRDVIVHRGGMACTDGEILTSLPLPIAGLMSDLPAEKVCGKLGDLKVATERTGAIDDAFMYLSFLSLTVIPEIRITPSGVFDAIRFAHVPLFEEPDQVSR